MRFLVDECTGPAVAEWLRRHHHDVVSVYEQTRGSVDDAILQQAMKEDRILITNDKDFGQKVYRDRRPHPGVILLRLEEERPVSKIAVLSRLRESVRGRASRLLRRGVRAAGEVRQSLKTHCRFGVQAVAGTVEKSQ